MVYSVKSSVSNESRVGSRAARSRPDGAALGGVFTPLSITDDDDDDDRGEA